MSRDASLDLFFGGDERHFAFPIEQLLALQDARDCAWTEILHRLMFDVSYFQDVRETIRLGLIGGGAEVKKAKELVEEFVVPGNLGYCQRLAITLLAVVLDDGGEPVGKGLAAPDKTGANASPPPPSTEPLPQSESR